MPLTTYVLIFALQAIGGYPVTAATAEFNSLAACQAAAAEIKKQADASARDSSRGTVVSLMMCANKGVK